MGKKLIAVIGASGFIGQSILGELAKNHEVIGTSLHNSKDYFHCDITDRESVRGFIASHKPGIVIHLAALTDVDLCERDKALAKRIHVGGTKNVVDACRAAAPKLIYFSTDFVFDGVKGNYSETDAVNPINNYGRTKLDGEQLVASMPGHVILRTSTPYSLKPGSKKFIGILLEKLSRGEKASAFADFVRSPTMVENLAENVAALISNNYSGVLHVAGSSQLSMYDAALQVAGVFGFDPSLVQKTESSSVSLDAPRPLDTGMDVSLARRLGFKVISFREGLLKLKKQAAGRNIRE